MEEKIDKELVFIWFGDNEPSYATWSIENFKQMNPSWNVKYIKYSTDQILNHHKELNDQVLEKTIICFNENVAKYSNSGDIAMQKNKLTMSCIANIYKCIYLAKNKIQHDIMVYCDLDCFPIAPLDNFFIKIPYSNSIAASNANGIRNAGIWIYRSKDLAGKHAYVENKDSWLIYVANKHIGIKQNLYQIVKFAQLDKELGYSKDTKQFIFNVGSNDQIVKILQYRQKFLDKKLQLGECLCNPFFTPIEHMQIAERYKPDAYIIKEKIK